MVGERIKAVVDRVMKVPDSGIKTFEEVRPMNASGGILKAGQNTASRVQSNNRQLLQKIKTG